MVIVDLQALPVYFTQVHVDHLFSYNPKVTFTNTLDPENELVSLSLTKQLDLTDAPNGGANMATGEYVFEVMIYDPTFRDRYSGSVSFSHPNYDTYTRQADLYNVDENTSKLTIILSRDQTVYIDGLKNGTGYEIIEKPALGYCPSYVITGKGRSGDQNIALGSKSVTSSYTTLSTGRMTVDNSNGTIEAVFTNTYKDPSSYVLPSAGVTDKRVYLVSAFLLLCMTAGAFLFINRKRNINQI